MEQYKNYAVIVYVTETEHRAVMRMFDWQELPEGALDYTGE